jgi:hypothetical protein
MISASRMKIAAHLCGIASLLISLGAGAYILLHSHWAREYAPYIPLLGLLVAMVLGFVATYRASRFWALAVVLAVLTMFPAMIEAHPDRVWDPARLGH